MVQMVKDEAEKRRVRHDTLVIDGTFLEKAGEEMEGAGWFCDHSQNKSILAHNLVSNHYTAGRFHVPLGFDICVKRNDCGVDKKLFRTMVEMAKELVEKAIGYGFPIDIVVFGSWYISEELTSFVREKGVEAYVTEENGDRIMLSDDSKTETSLLEWATTIPRRSFEPVRSIPPSSGRRCPSMPSAPL